MILAEIEDRVASDAIEPDVAADVSIADAHRHQSHVNAARRRQSEVAGHDLALNADGDRAQRVAPAIFAGEEHSGTSATGNCGRSEAGGRHRRQTKSK